jgi:chemotaxis protein histidine kinase CheA
MPKYWAITIGINQYQHFQPLLHAQRDAIAMRDFWIKEGGFAPDQCLLLSDVSPTLDKTANHANRKTIETYIVRLCQQLQPGDFLWCFFSGYGMQFEGKDYLMPIEGDPTQVAATGIPIEPIFDHFRAAATNNILLVLDMNWSQNIQASDRFGAQTTLLANEHEIATILSCAPDQVSPKALALDQGLVTAVMLEGMRLRSCTTLDQLARYISGRTPELSGHNWYPRHAPVVIVPNSKRYQPLLPERANATASATTEKAESAQQPLDVAKRQSSQAHPAASAKAASQAEAQSSPFWQHALLGGAIVLGALLIIWRSGGVVFRPSPSDSHATSSSEAYESPSLHSNVYTAQSGQTAAASSDAHGDETGESHGTAQSEASAPTSANPEAEHTTQGGHTAAQPASQVQASPETAKILEQARTALQARQHEQALTILNQIPENQRNEEYNSLRQQSNQGLLNDARVLLNQARNSNHVNQASNFSYAIALARRIPAGDPLYEEAQQDIARWTQVIWDIAQGRANQGSYDMAIAAARLIPPDQVNIYPAVQAALPQWQQAKANQALLERAKRSIRQYEPTSYGQAITTIRSIKPDQPYYNEAQTLTSQWSETILNLARAHATQGEFRDAVQAATFIPQGVPVYQEAQAAIGQWRSQRQE